MAKKNKPNPLWGGHYEDGPSAIMAEINASIDVDKRMFSEDIDASKAHAEMLVAQGIISKKDGQDITKGLETIRGEIQSGDFQFSKALEDVHMNIEARLKDLIGDAAGRLHTARSRNDQVATDFRLWLRNALKGIDADLKDLQSALLDQAERHAGTLMPGFTHLQPAQPITFGHHLMAYVEMVGRDRARLQDCSKRLNESPLGAAALAGTSFPIDRMRTSKALAFDRPMANSLDAVSARDFALEFLASSSIAGMHLSRLAEELVIWTNPRFGFVKLSEAFTSGSSIMPQKRNPDAAELVRAKTGRLLGNFTTLLTVMKGLALAYAKDMQEDKQTVFDTSDTIRLMIAATAGMVRDMKPDEKALLRALDEGFITATDLADWLVREAGIPFRDAHHITGRIVRLAEGKHVQLKDLSLEEMKQIDSRIDRRVVSVLDPANAVKSRTSFGGTAPKQVAKAVQAARKRFMT